VHLTAHLAIECLSLMKTYRMSLISAVSISLDSTFNELSMPAPIQHLNFFKIWIPKLTLPHFANIFSYSFSPLRKKIKNAE
jgi:hypothetical protein